MKNSIFFSMTFAICLFANSCKSSYDYSYEKADYPKFEADLRDTNRSIEKDSILHVLSFNIEFSNEIKAAIDLLKNKGWENVDILLLQEMEEESVHKIAKSLKLNYIYYPATNHPVAKKNMGSAILTRGEILRTEKIMLPHPTFYPKPFKFKKYLLRKTATVAHIHIHGKTILAASTHAPAIMSTDKRREFTQSLLDQLESIGSDYVIVGGDFNSFGAADMDATILPFTAKGYAWATKNIGTTISEAKSVLKKLPKSLFQLDHLFVKNLSVIGSGKIIQKGVSDHLPVWVEIAL